MAVAHVQDGVRGRRAVDVSRPRLVIDVFVRTQAVCRGILRWRSFLSQRGRRQKTVCPERFFRRCTTRVHQRGNRQRGRDEAEGPGATLHGGGYTPARQWVSITLRAAEGNP